MYALTIRLPWASLIAQGIKTVESRSWPIDHRGWLAIHAGATPDERAPTLAWELADDDDPPGAVIAVARVVRVDEERGVHRWASADAEYHWVLGDVTRVRPIPCRGRQGLWLPPPHVIDAVLDGLTGGSLVVQ